MKKLIMNADDFGLSEAVNYGILKGFQDGILTSTTIMANMPGFDHAVELAKQHPEMHIGVHLNLTCYKPLLQTHKTLVTETGYFRNQLDIDVYDEEEMYQELEAQIEKVLAAGIKIDHLDSHHHIHTTEKLRTVIKRLLEKYPYPIRGGFVYENDVKKSELIMAFYNEGVSLESFEQIVKGMEDGKTYDLMCHPAYIDKVLTSMTSYYMKRIEELDIICKEECKTLLEKEKVKLVSYAEIQ